MKCSICKKEIKEHSNNAQPYKSGDCCDECNFKYVLPLRVFLTGSVKDQVLIISTVGKIAYQKIDTDELLLETSQKIVEGYIEFYPIKDDNFYYLVDEEGILQEKKANPLALKLFNIKVVGTLLVCPKNLLK